MKADDLGFFSKHAEKLALGLGGLVLALLAFTQFVLQPNKVEINNREVSPSEIQEAVVREAELLSRKLEGITTIEPIDIPKYTETFQKLYALDVASDQPLTGLLARTGVPAELAVRKPVVYQQRFLPSPPVPADLIVKSGHGVLSDTGDQYFVALRSIIGEQIPSDFPYVSVTSNFPFSQWKARLEAPNAPAEQRIDPNLWSRRMAITAVYLQRQELNLETGKWGDPTLIRPLPGQFAILPEQQASRTLEEAEQAESDIRSAQAEIRLPSFPQIINGIWTPPDYTDRVLTPDELTRQRQLQDDIVRLERNIDRMLQDMGQAGQPRTARRTSPSEDEMGGGPGFDDRRTPRTPRQPDRRGETEGPDREATRLTRAQDELIEKQRELNTLLGVEEADLGPTTLGYESDGGFGDRSPSFDRGRPAPSGPTDQLPEKVKVWAHDLTVLPGRTYRYKLIVCVLNPLYRQSRLPEEQARENFNRISLPPDAEELADADWSPPIALDPEYFFFITSANRDQKRVDAEVWKIWNGVWRKATFTEYPGGEIGGVASIPGIDDGGLGIRMDVGKILIDVDAVSGAGVGGRGSAVRALYLDPTIGRIDSRLAEQDRNSDDRLRLENEEKRQRESQQAAGQP